MKKITISIILIAISLLMSSMLFSPSSAKSTNTIYDNYNGMPFTQTTGNLGGADYVIYMPEAWNGRFIVGCTGYNYFQDPHPEFGFDLLAKGLVSAGYAFAACNYNGGERAWLVKEGIIRTHQLTMYVVDKYQVTDKIFLVGFSMGGQIALNLAVEYPMLYSGVLDVCGSKGSLTQYNLANLWVTLPVPILRAIFSIPSSVSDDDIAGLKVFFTQVMADLTDANNGKTRENKPNTYEKHDTTLHADISIPVISVIGGADPIVPVPVHLEYQAAVINSGHADLYRQYIVPIGGHLDQPILDAVPSHLIELISWSDNLD